MPWKAEDLTGQKFGRLTVIERCKENTKDGKAKWICKCNCGKIHITRAASLKSGNVKSCGCISKEAKHNYKHGMTHSKLYSIWHNMKDRCYRENHRFYKDYGGRGIIVCDEWKNDFTSFYEWSIKSGYKNGLTLDRIDNDSIYSPDNCRWETRTIQANNRRTNHLIEFNGEQKSLTEWSKEYSINYQTIQTRLLRGWSIEKALTTPSKKSK